MKNRKIPHPENIDLNWLNTTGSAIASGAVVGLGDRIGIAYGDIAAGAYGMVACAGTFELPAITGVSFSQGDDLVWDAANSRLDLRSAKPSELPAGRCRVPKDSAVAIAQTDIEQRPMSKLVTHTVTGGEAALGGGNGLVTKAVGVGSSHTRVKSIVIIDPAGTPSGKLITNFGLSSTGNNLIITGGTSGALPSGALIRIELF